MDVVKSIFEELEDYLRCTYRSDLRQIKYRYEIQYYISRCNPNEYTIKEWLDLHNYIVGYESNAQTASEICASIVRKKGVNDKNYC
ncbi:MAG: hypothetical protein R3Y47_00440 [Lachnospiraceae bacterium]